MGEMTSQQFITVKMYDQMLGMVNNMPAYRINHKALADLLNIRVERGELRTAAGRDVVNATAAENSATIQGIGVGARTDGTRDIVFATSGNYWSLDGDTKTLISKWNRSYVSRILTPNWGLSSYAPGASGGNFVVDVATGDSIFLSAEGHVSAYSVTAIPSYTTLQASPAYFGFQSAGDYGNYPYYITPPIADAKTRIRKYLGRWFFCDGTNLLREWDPARNVSGAFRPVGTPSGEAFISATPAAGGSLDADDVYKYKSCNEDFRGRYGNPGPDISATTTSANKTITLKLPPIPYYSLYRRIYRTAGDGATFYYLTKIHMSATDYSDAAADSTITANAEPPTLNYQPPTGVDDFIFYRDRMFLQIGSEVRVCGLPPLDAHAGDPPGLFQPEYDPARSIYLGRDRGAQKDGRGFFILHGRLYAMQSDSVWVLIDTSWDPAAWRFEELFPNIGCESQWTIDTDGENAYWLGRKNGRLTVFQFDGVSQPRRIGEAVENNLAAITATSSCVGACGLGYYRLTLEMSATRELEWNADNGFGRGSWCTRDWKHTCYARDTVSAFGGTSTGFIQQLETGLTDAASAMTYQVDFPAVSQPEGMEQLRDYPKHWQRLKVELEAISGISGLSGYYSMDGGSMVALSADSWPLSAGAGSVRIHRTGMPKAHGRDCQIRLKASGTTVKFIVRGLVVAAIPEFGWETQNSSGGAL